MSRIQMYTTRWCGYCVRAKALLDSKGLAYEEIHLDDDPCAEATNVAIRDVRSVV